VPKCPIAGDANGGGNKMTKWKRASVTMTTTTLLVTIADDWRSRDARWCDGRFHVGTVFVACTQSQPLGMTSGAIHDCQVTSSSVYPAEWDRGCAERHARVYLPNRLAWCARYKSASEWLQIDLGVLTKVFFSRMTLVMLLFNVRSQYCFTLTGTPAARAPRWRAGLPSMLTKF